MYDENDSMPKSSGLMPRGASTVRPGMNDMGGGNKIANDKNRSPIDHGLQNIGVLTGSCLDILSQIAEKIRPVLNTEQKPEEVKRVSLRIEPTSDIAQTLNGKIEALELLEERLAQLRNAITL